MNLHPFASLPDEAPLWIYAFARPLGESDQALIRRTLESFLPRWETHGTPVRGAFEVSDDRFVMLAGHLEGGISGCSIDSSVRNFKILRDTHGLDGLDRSLVFYRDPSGTIRSTVFTAFQQLVESGEVTPETPVFDTTIQTLGELRAGRFERPFAESWHARSFPTPAVKG